MTAGAYAHPTISRFATADGMLRIGGPPVGLLAERAGATPFFTYERTRLTRRVEELRRALPNDIHPSYAVKANPMHSAVQHFKMAVAPDTPIAADRVSFAGPGKTPAELSRSVAARVTISLESETEALRVAAIGEWLGMRPRVAVCVDPDFQVKGSGMRLGGGSQQFGVDAEQLPALLTRPAAMDLDVLGFHVFAGSQNLYADVLAEAHGRTADLVVRLAGAAPQPVRYVNLGGALGIPYFERDQALDLATIGDNLTAVTSERLRPALPEARILLELGRFLVGEAGGYVTRVVDRKSRTATPSSPWIAASTNNALPGVASGGSSAGTTRSPSRTEWASRLLRLSASSGACAPCWTCSHVMSASRVPRSATFWRSFGPAPTGSRPVPQRSSAIRHRRA